MKTQVAIVGGGLAGLSCALRLQKAGIEWQLFEGADGLGGRVRTDVVDGFRMDRGFQVLLEAYPECQAVLDYESLDLRPFAPGAKVWVEGRLHTVADPLRAPLHLLDTVNAPVGSLMDKVRVLALRNRALKGSLADVFRQPETSTRKALEQIGFSRQMIESFFAPWLGGIFLNRELVTSSRMMDFVFRMMASGNTVVPAKGMGEIPAQMAGFLNNAGAIHLNRPVASVASGQLTLADGEVVEAERIVVATEAPAAARLVGAPTTSVPGVGVTCLYYALEDAPIEGPWLLLDGDRSGPVNNIAFMSQVSADYAPAGQDLAAVTILDCNPSREVETRKFVERQLRRWFGGSAESWRHLRTYHIPHAQPAQLPGFREERRGPAEVLPGVLVCGDHRETASINGAMRSGRQAAVMVAKELSREVATA